MNRWIWTVVALACAVCAGQEGVEERVVELDRFANAPVHGWRFHFGEAPGAEAPGFDDADWTAVEVGHRWLPDNSTCWYRARIEVPERVCGLAARGRPLRLELGVDNEAEVYVDGTRQARFEWDGTVALTEQARPGAVHVVALHCFNRPGYGSLYRATLVPETAAEALARLREFTAQCRYALDGLEDLEARDAAFWRSRVRAALDMLNFDPYYDRDMAAFVRSVARATEALAPQRNTLERRLGATETALDTLDTLIERGRNNGMDLAYLRADARLVRSFVQYARDDMADGEWRHAVRALKTAAYIDTLCHDSIERMKSHLAHPKLDRPVPRCRTGPVEIRDGAFWQDGRSVFFTGVGHFSQVRRDIPLLNDYGLNIIQIEMGPRVALPAPGEVDTDAIERNVVDALERAAEHQVMVNLLISPHYFPAWAVEQHPELDACGEGFLQFCVDHPAAREIFTTWLNALMPLIKDQPALHSICLSNEPQYQCDPEQSRPRFLEWLEERHGGVAGLNAAWGTDYGDFEAIPWPPERSHYPLYFDWCEYTQEVFLDFHRFERALIHEHAPGLPVHAKVQSLAFDNRAFFEKGIDFEAFAKLGRIVGNDCFQVYAPWERGPYPQQWRTMAMNYTLQRSVAPDRPIFNSEAHVIQDESTHHIPGAHIRNAYWMQAVHGQGAATTWVWERHQGGDHAGNILTRANCVRALGHIGLDLLRLHAEVRALQKAPAEAALFYARSSLLPDQRHIQEARKAFEGAYFTGVPWEFVTERQALGGGLSGYKLVVVPEAAHVPADVRDAFQAYLEHGGALVLVGACFAKDEYGKPHARALEPGEAGRLVSYPYGMTPRAWRDILADLLERNGVSPRFQVLGPHSEPVWGVHLRTADLGGAVLANLVNFTRAPKTIQLKGDRPVAEARNLFTNKPVGLPLELPPLEPVLLRIAP